MFGTRLGAFFFKKLPGHLVVGCEFLALVTGVRIPARQHEQLTQRSKLDVFNQNFIYVLRISHLKCTPKIDMLKYRE